jgi:2',3'-cyclic-nucleotide 2'-phosphodiesterase (5'-nucleotidase family)
MGANGLSTAPQARPHASVYSPAMSATAGLLAFLAFAEAQSAASARTTISVVGTSDLHGHLAALPWFSGYLHNLRSARAPGAVILLDGGDMFQGTLESNLAEGAPVVDAYNALGYSAAAIGNHEFDFGPEGPAPAPAQPGDDPRGALKARAAQARFPFLAANLVDRASHARVAWSNVVPSVLIDAVGIKVGVVGVVTASTPHTALPANVAGLDFLPLAATIARESRRLRARGAKVVIAVAHEGGTCQSFDNPDALESCDVKSEIFAIARTLPRRSVDAIVAGHTHQAVAQRVAGIPVIQAYANGRAFGRVDLTVDRKTGKVLASHPEAPQEICPSRTPDACEPRPYLGRPVQRDEDLAALLAPAFARAKSKGDERLGVEVVRPLPHSRTQETALGNLVADLMRAHRRDGTSTAPSDYPVAMINGGGLRTGFPTGPLTFARLYETFPFDNAFAFAHISAVEFRALLARSLARSASLVSLSGLRVRARCKDQSLEVNLGRPDGSPLPGDTRLALATTDFLATGGDGFFANAKVSFTTGPSIRDELAAALRRRGGTLAPDDATLFDPAHPRFDLPGQVPIRCGR